MSKQSLLLVDGDTRSLRVLEVSLRKAGFTVTPAASVKDALDTLELHPPDLIISETSFATEPDGFELRRRVRGTPDWAEIPFVFLTAETAIENKIRGLELGVDDYLTKPIYIKEIVTRINILLQKKQRANFEERKDGVRFAGRVADMPVVDIIQTIEVSRKSGVIQFVGTHGRQAAIYFRDGKVIDAEAGTLLGEDAVYRLLTWNDGEFEVVFRTVRRREVIATSSQGLLMEGMRRLDEWSRLHEQLPPLSHRFEIDIPELSSRLGEIPDDHNRILRLFDGKRTLLEVIDASDFGDLECLQAISKLYFEELLIDLDPGVRTKRDTGRPLPLVVIEDFPTPIEEVVSGPIPVANLARHVAAAEAAARAAHASAREDGGRHGELAATSADDGTSEPGPLLGGYRPSSLRLIDEAVAAAQAIDPLLFEDEPPAPASQGDAPAGDPAIAGQVGEDGVAVARVQLSPRTSDPRVVAARGLVERTRPADGEHDEAAGAAPGGARSGADAGARPEADPAEPAEPADAANGAVPMAIEADEPPPHAVAEAREVEAVNGSSVPASRKFAATVRRDDAGGRPLGALGHDESGMRMIGSLGRDRAEASGELMPPPQAPPSEGEPQRELVTILPRRITREFAAVAPPPDAAVPPDAPEPEAPPPAPPPDREEARAPVPPPADRDEALAAPAPSGPADPEPDDPEDAPRPARGRSRSDTEALRREGPGTVAKTMMIAASVLAGAIAYMYCHQRPSARKPITGGGSAVAGSGGGGSAVAGSGGGGSAVAGTPDAAAVRVAVDAAAVARAHDAGVAPDAYDRNAEAKVLLQRAHAAIEDADPETALALIDKSLMLRHTARGYLERARALQRLGRIEDALASVDSAMKLAPNYAPAWSERGLILWSARRYDEGRAALKKYLQLQPTGKTADTFRRMLEEHP